MTPLKKFDINEVSRKLNSINYQICVANSVPFPPLKLLSSYRFKKKPVKIMPNGDIQGGLCKMITSLIDFSFVRSLTAPLYSIKGPPPYDPPTLFLLELFRYIENYPSMIEFLKVVRDKDRGRAYRAYAGIHKDIPTKGTFTNFKNRLGAAYYNEIFHILVHLFHQLEMITFDIIAHDGSLYPTRARYHNCPYFSDECEDVRVNGIIDRARNQIMTRLNNLAKVDLDKSFKIKTKCPCSTFPEDNKRPVIEVLNMKLVPDEGDPSDENSGLAMLFGVKDLLDKQGLRIQLLHSKLDTIAPDDDTATFCCPKLPKDTDARVGVRRDPENPNKKEKIFGYNIVLSTSVELDIKLELPVAVTNIPGNAEEGKKIIDNKEQIIARHDCETKFDIADAKYDTTENYEFLRQKGSIPIIDYNPRNENLTDKKVRERGYDRNGWPFAPCGIKTKPNGFDKERQRNTFCCFKQCLTMKATGIKNLQKEYDIAECPHIHNRTGYTEHTYIADNPRLYNEIPRGTDRYNEIKRVRSASERANSTLKENLDIINNPIVYNRQQADILAQIGAIALLLTRALEFIAKISALFLKYNSTKDPNLAEKLMPHYVPPSIRSLIQKE